MPLLFYNVQDTLCVIHYFAYFSPLSSIYPQTEKERYEIQVILTCSKICTAMWIKVIRRIVFHMF